MEAASSFEEIPDQKQLERKFNRLRLINWPILAVVVIVDLFLVVDLFLLGSAEMLLLALVSFAIISGPFWFGMSNLYMQKKVDLHTLDDDEMIGLYSAGEMKTLVAEVFEPYEGQEIPHVYITYDGETNVLVLNSVLLNRVKSQNAIYISEPYFHILTKGEFKAIISHELGHFYKYTPPVQRMKTFVFLLAGVLPVYAFAIDEYATFDGFIGLWIISTVASFIFFFVILSGPFGHMEEYLCDYYAAERHGKLNMINALLMIGKRQELEDNLFEVILERIRQDQTLSLANVSEIFLAIAQKLPNMLFVDSEEVEQIVNAFFESEELDPFRTQLNADEVKDEEQQIEDIRKEVFDKAEFQLLDWDKFDFAEKNMRIDAEEYPFLIDTILKHPEGQLFNLVVDNRQKTAYETHPTFGQRILFLDKAERQ